MIRLRNLSSTLRFNSPPKSPSLTLNLTSSQTTETSTTPVCIGLEFMACHPRHRINCLDVENININIWFAIITPCPCDAYSVPYLICNYHDISIYYILTTKVLLNKMLCSNCLFFQSSNDLSRLNRLNMCLQITLLCKLFFTLFARILLYRQCAFSYFSWTDQIYFINIKKKLHFVCSVDTTVQHVNSFIGRYCGPKI